MCVAAGGRAASRGEEEEEEAALRAGTRHLPAPGAGFIPRRSLLGKVVNLAPGKS